MEASQMGPGWGRERKEGKLRDLGSGLRLAITERTEVKYSRSSRRRWCLGGRRLLSGGGRRPGLSCGCHLRCGRRRRGLSGCRGWCLCCRTCGCLGGGGDLCCCCCCCLLLLGCRADLRSLRGRVGRAGGRRYRRTRAGMGRGSRSQCDWWVILICICLY